MALLSANSVLLRLTHSWVVVLLLGCASFWFGLHYACRNSNLLETDVSAMQSHLEGLHGSIIEQASAKLSREAVDSTVVELQGKLIQQQERVLELAEKEKQLELLKVDNKRLQDERKKLEERVVQLEEEARDSSQMLDIAEDEDVGEVFFDKLFSKLNDSGVSMEDLEKVVHMAEDLVKHKNPLRDPVTGVTYDVEDKPPYGAPPDPNPKKDAKVMAFVLTFPKRHDPKAIAVNLTWGQDFDFTTFVTSEPFRDLNTVILKLQNESRSTLWPKTKMAWMHMYDNYLDKYDWFMKADDDSFVVVKNLRRMLSKYDPNVPHFFGRRFLLHRGDRLTEHSYNSGGAGYVLSRAALKKLGDNQEMALKNRGLAEDVEIARSLKKIGIYPEDTRDEEGRETFLPLNIDHLRYKYTRKNKPNFWYWRYIFYPPRDGMECCSKHWISTHYIYSQDLYRLHKIIKAEEDASGKDPNPAPNP